MFSNFVFSNVQSFVNMPMPIKVNYFSNFSKRFDFGVPLEDVFPPNDIHPRLKYLFEEAYKLYISSKFNIEQVVRYLQGPLETRLELKHKIIHDLHYNIKIPNIEHSPGAYFWLIRHFLGLLPIPLFPIYSRQIYFDWISLSQKCKNFLKDYESESEKKFKLDYEFAENLNLLPFEHFLLLTILVHFIRKISKIAGNGRQINRRALVFLCKYYCASTCIRPYTPGYKDEKMFPLFFYIVLRWRQIENYCRIIGHPVCYLENNYLHYETYPGFCIRDNWAQTTHFSPEVITVLKNVPYFCDNNNYLRDISCQTEQVDSVDKSIQKLEACTKQESNTQSKHENLSGQVSVYPSLSDSQLDDNNFIRKTSSPLYNKRNQSEKINNNEFSFMTEDDVGNKSVWSEVVKETAGTIKKLEEYIYDDYDTFNKEEYNQITENGKSRGSLRQKISKIGWTYTPQNSARNEHKEGRTTVKEDDTYINFEDIFDENGGFRTNGENEDHNDCQDNDQNLNVTFKRGNGSKTCLCNGATNLTNKNQSEEKNKKNFNLKKFKLKLSFLRALTPKKTACPTPSYDSIASNVKYKRIKNKSNTL